LIRRPKAEFGNSVLDLHPLQLKYRIPPTMKQLAEEIFHALRKMDEEATPVMLPWPTGLRDYAVFRKGGYDVKGSSSREDAISDGLIEVLKDKGYECQTRPRYPNSNKKCDILLKSSGIKAGWIEVKGAWRNLFDDKDTDCSVRRRENPSFATHLQAAAEDADKLLRELDKSNASHVGVLLIAFGSQHFPITDEHISVVGSHAAGWTFYSDRWDDHAWRHGTVRSGMVPLMIRLFSKVEWDKGD
jgi:hypothetical protein